MSARKKFYNFIQFDPTTKNPIYCLFNFNYTQYAADYSIVSTAKYDIFTDFWVRNGFDWYKKYIVKPQFIKYFSPITTEMINYLKKYGFSLHYGYFLQVVPKTFIPIDVLLNSQFDMIPYGDNQIQRLQDYYFEDDTNTYTSYNFDFKNYSNDFDIYGTNLLQFTDFVIRNNNTSGTIINASTSSYGLSDFFKKYFFYQGQELIDFLGLYGVTSVVNNSPKWLGSIDFVRYLIQNPDLEAAGVNIDNVYEYYIRQGQFEQRTVPFIIPQLSQIEIARSSACVVTSSNTFGTGFLYRYKNDQRFFVVTVYHLIRESQDMNYFYASFQLINPNPNGDIGPTSTTAKFLVVGYDRFSDVLVGLYDPTLTYNVVNKVDMTPYISLDIDIINSINYGDEVLSLGNIGKDDILGPLKGTIINNAYSGAQGEVSRPLSYLIQSYISPGCSGSPLFRVSESNDLTVVGMINSSLDNSPQDSVAISGYMLSNITNTIISYYDSISYLYELDLIKYQVDIKNGYPIVWLGANIEYWYPTSQLRFRELSNLSYTGGILLTNFLVGFDYISQTEIYNPKDLNRHEIFELYGPLINTRMYRRFIQNSKVPIVVKSIFYFDSAYASYVERYVGKYSKQVAFSYYIYGNQPIAIYANDPKYSNPFKYAFSKINVEYYWYNGSFWEEDTEQIGGNGPEWYVEYTDINNNLYYQHKFEYPLILIDYISERTNSNNDMTPQALMTPQTPQTPQYYMTPQTPQYYMTPQTPQYYMTPQTPQYLVTPQAPQTTRLQTPHF